MKVFCLNASRPLGESIALALGQPLDPHEEREFEDGEHKVRPLVSVQDEDVYIIQSLYGDSDQSVNDKLCRMLFFIGAVKDAGAQRVTAVIPYLGYARKDRRTKSRDPVTSRYVAQLFESVGTDRAMVLDVHNRAAFDNAFRCPTVHLEAQSLFVSYMRGVVGDEPLSVVSPDVGGVKRARLLCDSLQQGLGHEVSLGFMEKKRSSGVVSGERLFADVRDSTVIIIDDLISTGGTLMRAVESCSSAGAAHIYAAATHGLFIEPAGELIDREALTRLVITDSVPPFRLDASLVRRKVDILETGPLFAEAINPLHAAKPVGATSTSI
jgi:ribose-phosphate pyrophosphokinase